MKKLLASLLCSIPLIANAVNVGGFEFKKERVFTQDNEFYVLTYEAENGSFWPGIYNKGTFVLVQKASGKNKVWIIGSATKGQSLGDKHRSFLFLQELNCEEMKSRELLYREYLGYFATGEILNSVNDTQAWRYGRESDFNLYFGCKILKGSW